MTHEETNIELFKKEARKIYMLNSPIIPTGQIEDIDAEKYTELRNAIQDKILEDINAPDIPVKIKIDIIATLEDELNTIVNKNIIREG